MYLLVGHSLHSCYNSCPHRSIKCGRCNFGVFTTTEAVMEHESTARRAFGFAQLLLLVGAVLRPSVSVAGEGGPWWLEVSAAGKTYRVRADGSGWTEVPQVVSRGILSPD